MSHSFFYNEALFDNTTNKNIKEWLNSKCPKEEKQEIIDKISSDPSFIKDAFSKKLSFGTGGLRALMRIGPNSINVYTIRAASQGLITYLLKNRNISSTKKSVVIGYDNRHHSRNFAIETAKIFIDNAFTVYLYGSVCPIALVSFGILYKESLIGIMITASHNSAAYNGYKVFTSYGGQVVSPQDQQISEEISNVHLLDVRDFSRKNLNVSFVDQEIFEAYINKIYTFQLYPKVNKTQGSCLKVIYSNLHGTGVTFIPKVLNSWGFTSLFLVKEQMDLDGNFPTVLSPNPEDNRVLDIGVKYLKKQKGDLLIATDPDCDRLGLALLYKEGIFYFTGNQLASLLLEYICSSLHFRNELKKNHCVVKTLVTTEMLREIADNYNVHIVNVLTGFKYIGEKIAEWSFSHEYEFLFGAEESQGYLYKDHVRDKDAVLMSALTVEMALYFKIRGKSLLDALFSLYQKYGWYHARTLQLNFTNCSPNIITELMTKIRERMTTSFEELGKKKIFCIEDYFTGNMNFINGEIKKSQLPSSNVLKILFEDGSKVVFRPSGTEPKLKLYFEIVNKRTFNDITEALNILDKELENFISYVRKELKV